MGKDIPRGAKLNSYATPELSNTVVLVCAWLCLVMLGSGLDTVNGTQDGVMD